MDEIDKRVETYLFVLFQIVNHVTVEGILRGIPHANFPQKLSIHVALLH
jgi:hypothetical protein